MGTNNYKTNNNNCTKPIDDKVNKIVKEMAKDIEKMAEATGIKTEDIITKLIAELRLSLSIGDIDTTIKTGDVPLFSGNTFNISIGDVTVAERGGRIKNKKKGGKKKNK